MVEPTDIPCTAASRPFVKEAAHERFAHVLSNSTFSTHRNIVFPLERAKLLLLALVRLDKGVEHLLDTRVVGFQSGDDVLDGALNEDAADKTVARALGLGRNEGLEGAEDKTGEVLAGGA